jgi:hypothetical protein
MTWASSAVFRALVTDLLKNANTVGSALDLDTDVPKVALFNNTPTPSKDVTSANSAYNVDQWATAQEVYQAGQWAQGGVALSGAAISNPSAGVAMYDATDTASGSAATLASVYGCQVYDDTLTGTVADQGLSYNYFGGTNSVTNGTLTVVWHANGIFRFTT